MSNAYLFDLWAEFLTISISENIAQCQLGLNRIKKVRLTLPGPYHWPVQFKVILDNERIAPSPLQESSFNDGSYPIHYAYRCPSAIQTSTQQNDAAAQSFIKRARTLNRDFYDGAWSLTEPQDMPYLLKQLAYRSVIKLIPKQLKHLGLQLDENLSIQLFDEQNYLSFSYDALKQSLIQQKHYYLKDKELAALAAKVFFKHKVNRQWFASLN